VEAIVAALGLSAIQDDRPVSTLSGGQKTRLGLALVLLGDPQLLLLDEPTNHLDIEMLEWLEDWLSSYPSAAMIVSHDRTFLDHTVSRILDLNLETHTLREYAGNYTQYLEQYLAERGRQIAAYKDQEYEIHRMKQDIARTKQQSLRVESSTTPRQPGVRRIAKKVARKALSREKKLDRYLESDERVEKVRESWQMKADFFSAQFGAPPRMGQDVLTLEELAVGYAGHPPLLTGVNLYVRAGRRIAITGPNGAGKTSLLRTISGVLAPLSGSFRLGMNVRLGYMAQEQEILDPARSALETVQSVAPLNDTEARSFLHYFLFTGDDPLRPSRELSYGERARLSLAMLVAQGCNFLLLDEPINHLDIPSRTRFEQALEQFEGTVLAVVHDRYFIERFADELWLVAGGGVKQKL
jgi:ATP-binding cassette subfamily F protein 3